MKKTLEHIESVIYRLQENYKKLNEDWLEYLVTENLTDFYENKKLKFSLKGNTVLDLRTDEKLFEFVQVYQAFVVDRLVDFVFDNVRARIKSMNSIQSKIETYIQLKAEAGQVPIIKCLNDICGTRIEIDDDVTFQDIISDIKTKYPDLKVTDATKSCYDYKAVHVYFKNGGKYFPLELQIWYKKDHDSNVESHARYKQTYINWEGENQSYEIAKKEET